MTVTLKLYASLMRHLPAGAEGHALRIDAAEGTTPLDLLERYGVPLAQVHLVLVNGVFLAPAQRRQPLGDGDELAVWPAVAGG
jgi:molybdopterin converting factor small subunit